MKAIVYSEYGGPEVLRLVEVAKPRPVGDQALVAIRAVSVNAPDRRLMRADPFIARASSGLLRPRLHTLGSDIAGIVEATGPEATQLRVGDAVFGDLSHHGFGGFAQYVAVTEQALVPKPATVSFEAAAASAMAAVAALQALRDTAEVRAGHRVLIAGASGGVGTFAVQLAKLLGAHVTAVCSTSKLKLARELGADLAIDYTERDFAAGDASYDAVVAINGSRSIWDYRRVLSPRGTYVMVGGDWRQMRQALLWGPLLSLFGSRRMRVCEARPTREDLAYVAELLAARRLQPVIDRHYPLHALADAMRYIEAGHAVGKVIIDVASEPAARRDEAGSDAREGWPSTGLANTCKA